MLKKLFALLMLVSLSFTTSACLPFSFDVDVNESSRSSDFDDDTDESSDGTANSRTWKDSEDLDLDDDADDDNDSDEEDSAGGGSESNPYVTTMRGYDIYIRDDGNLIIERNQIYLGNVTVRDASVSNGKILVGDFEIYIGDDDKIHMFNKAHKSTYNLDVDSCVVMDALTFNIYASDCR